MKFAPRPYQDIIIDHMLRLPRGNVWAGMGMGKTTSALTYIQLLHDLGYEEPTLVVAPLRVAQSTWPEEQLKWWHLRGLYTRFIGGPTTAVRMRAALNNDPVHTINIDQLPWLVDHFGKFWPYRNVIIDESPRLKGFRLSGGTERAKALARVAHTSKVRRWHNLTGTPSSNGLQDLWGPQWFIDKGEALGLTHTAFMERWFFRDTQRFIVTPHAHSMGEIMALVKPTTISLNANDWFKLDAPVIQQVWVTLPSKARAIYDDMHRRFIAEVSGTTIDAKTAADKSLKCLQIANGAVYEGSGSWVEIHDAKIDALQSIVNEAVSPVLVAYQFKHDRDRLLRAFKQARVLDDNPATIREWNGGKIPILLAHPKSAGHGLNLQDGGNVLVFFGHWWDLELRDQMLERIGPVRQAQSGHKRPVFVFDIVARETVDALVLNAHATKRAIQDVVLDSVRILKEW